MDRELDLEIRARVEQALRRQRSMPEFETLHADDAVTPAHERMWFLHSMTAESAAYHVTSAFSIEGAVDTSALERAFSYLIARHEMLRTGFAILDGRLTATTVPAAPFRLIHRAIDHDDESWLTEVTERPFDLSIPPLMRVEIASAGASHVLALAFHHIVSDGWSVAVFCRELGMVYAQLCRGEEPTLPPLPLSVRLAHGMLRADLRSERSRRLIDRWASRLDSAPPIELPFARPRPPVARFSGRRLEEHLDPSELAAIESLASANGATTYMVLLAALAITFHRLSGQEDLVFGSPVANRGLPGTDALFGLFVNTVIMRVAVRPEDTAVDVLRHARSITLEALEMQSTPLEQIVERLSPHRSLSHNPLFQVMIALQNAPPADLELAGALVTPLATNVNTVRFDLEWTHFPVDRGLRVRLVYNTDLFDEDVVRQLLAIYLRILRQFVQAPGACVADLAVLADEDRADIVAIERAAALVVPTPPLHEWFAAVAEREPTMQAVIAEDRPLTFAEVQMRAEAVATRLRERGVSTGDIVAVCMPREADLVPALLGVLAAGAAFVPIDPGDPLDRREFIVADSGCKVVIARDIEPFGDVECADLVGGCAAGSRAVARVAPQDPAYLIYTSGTTGRPKAVVVEHRNVVNTLRACHTLYRTDATDRGLVLAPFTFDVFYYELLAPLLAGGSSRIVTREEMFDPSRLSELLLGATSFQAVPGLMEHVIASLRVRGINSCHSMRHVITGGDLVPPELLARMKRVFPLARITITYGPTESAIFCTSYDVPSGTETKGHPIGRPIPGAVVRVGDARGEALPSGVAGEIWIGGAGVARGYHRRHDETAARFRIVGGERMYRSGDRGRRAHDGTIEYLGRIDHQVKVRGFRIELGEVESVIAAIPLVKRAIAVVDGDTPSDRRLIAYVSFADEALGLAADEAAAARKVLHWREVFEDAYAVRVRAISGTRDFTGWRSSYTNQSFPLAEMNDWLDRTLERIHSHLDPELLAERRLRVLDLGCGTGLVALALAARCARYVAVDFSRRALSDLRNSLRSVGCDHVEVVERDIEQIGDLATDFDLVIVNSVIQYLPDEGALRRVIDRGLARLRSGGVMFLGDVRSLPLLEVFHASIAAARTSVERRLLLDVARARAAEDGELVVDPRYFLRLAESHGGVRWVTAEPRAGTFANELTKYRYDVALCRGITQVGGSAAAPIEWGASWSLPRLRGLLQREEPNCLEIAGVPNALLGDDLALFGSIGGQFGAGQGLASVDLCELAETAREAGYRATLSCLSGDPTGAVDVLLEPADTEPRPFRPRAAIVQSASPYTNAPLRRAAMRALTGQVRDTLAVRLPNYMVPAEIIPLAAWPLTPNGKVDRDALPAPATAVVDGRRPESASERVVADSWRAVLGIQDLPVAADFFEVGGTSLLAIQVVVALRARGVAIQPQRIFELRTIERLARLIDDEQSPSSVHSRHEPAIEASEAPVGPVPSLREDPDAWRDRLVLLTGATGMLGIHLLDALLERGARVISLVRATDERAAAARLREQAQWYFRERTGTREIVVVCGDLRMSRLGLDERSWRYVLRCEHVVHAAADVRHVALREEVFATNLRGTLEIIALARDSGARLHHISTIGVKGVIDEDITAPTLTEVMLNIGQLPTEAYSESKLAAEHAVQAYRGEGGAVTVHRIGTVAPDWKTGRFQRNSDEHFFLRYLRSVLELGCAPRRDDRSFGLLPADLLARGIVRVAGLVEAVGHTFHWDAHHRTSAFEIAHALKSAGYPIDVLEPPELDARMMARPPTPSRDAAIGRLLAQLTPPVGRPVGLDMRWTRRWLEQLGIDFPAPTPEWFARIVAEGVALGYFPEAPRG